MEKHWHDVIEAIGREGLDEQWLRAWYPLADVVFVGTRDDREVALVQGAPKAPMASLAADLTKGPSRLSWLLGRSLSMDKGGFLHLHQGARRRT